MTYQDLVKDIFSDTKLKVFIVNRLRKSMKGLGYSDELVNDFLNNIDTLDLVAFDKKHFNELEYIRTEVFFNQFSRKYFSECVLPEIPATGKVLDLGCGRGLLIDLLLKRGTNQVVGIDIFDSPEWPSFRERGVKLEVVAEENFLDYIKKEKPDVVTITWVLHHMEYEQQKRYLKSLYDVLESGATVVVLEDSYAETIPPEYGPDLAESFFAWNKEDRHKIMGCMDWIANIIFGQKTHMPVPFAYRTLESWKEIFQEVGFEVPKVRFLGFPENRDIDTAQSIFVAKK